MCGRYVLFDDAENEEIRSIIDEINSRYNHEQAAALKTGEIYPTNIVPIITVNAQNKRDLTLMKWGFPNFRTSGVIINARCETVEEKPTFRKSLLSRRCLVPASGFYEWKPVAEKKKDKYLIRTREPAFYMAGLYNSFVDKGGALYEAFVIITTDANAEMADIHNRMPVILQDAEAKTWLNQCDDISEAKNVLIPYQEPLTFSISN